MSNTNPEQPGNSISIPLNPEALDVVAFVATERITDDMIAGRMQADVDWGRLDAVRAGSVSFPDIKTAYALADELQDLADDADPATFEIAQLLHGHLATSRGAIRLRRAAAAGRAANLLRSEVTFQEMTAGMGDFPCDFPGERAS